MARRSIPLDASKVSDFPPPWRIVFLEVEHLPLALFHMDTNVIKCSRHYLKLETTRVCFPLSS